MNRINPTPAFLLIFWVGFVCAISFMEAWIKFQAPGVTLTIGLSIGMLVFKALNLVEWALLIVSFGWMLTNYTLWNKKIKFSALIITVIILLQTFVLLPDLTKRALSLIAENPLPANPATHITYVVVEIIKVVLLIITTIEWVKLLRKYTTKKI